MKRQLLNLALIAIGFILSPLSWWNDAVVNIPIAYLFSLPFSLLDERLFLPAFLLGYWLTNVIGFLFLHLGGEGLAYRSRPTISIRRSVLISLVYSLVMAVLVVLGWIAPPDEWLLGRD